MYSCHVTPLPHCILFVFQLGILINYLHPHPQHIFADFCHVLWLTMSGVTIHEPCNISKSLPMMVVYCECYRIIIHSFCRPVYNLEKGLNLLPESVQAINIHWFHQCGMATCRLCPPYSLIETEIWLMHEKTSKENISSCCQATQRFECYQLHFEFNSVLSGQPM